MSSPKTLFTLFSILIISSFCTIQAQKLDPENHTLTWSSEEIDEFRKQALKDGYISALEGNSVVQCDAAFQYKLKRKPSCVYWYYMAALSNNENGILQLAQLFYTGWGVEKNIKEGDYWMLKLYQQGNGKSLYYAGKNLYSNYYKIGARFLMAEQFLTKSLQAGSLNTKQTLEAQKMIRIIQRGRGIVSSDETIGIDFLEYDAMRKGFGVAVKGDTTEQFKLAIKMSEKKMYDGSFHWFAQAALDGHVPSQIYIAGYYLSGYGTVKSNDWSSYWTDKLNNTDNAMAMYTVGKALYYGILGYPKNQELSKQFLELVKDSKHLNNVQLNEISYMISHIE